MPKGIKAREMPPMGAPLKQSDLKYLDSRAVSREYAHEEGWHRSGNRIGIPVRDANGVIVNVRRHLPPPRADGAPKTINTKGKGSPTRLAGIDRISKVGWVFVTGGEFDTAAAVTAGLNAVNGSNGEGNVPHGEYLESLKGLQVGIALDADDAGRIAARKWATALQSVAAEVRIVELPDGTDVNDWFVAGRTADDLIALVENTPVFGLTTRRDTAELLRMALDQTDEGKGRDDTGLWLACQLRDERYTRDEAWALMQTYQQAVEHDKAPAYTDGAARVNLDQAWSREPRKPSGKAPGERFPLSDLGNAERFVAHYGERCRYIPALGEWWIQDGQRWASDHTGQVERWAKASVRTIAREAEALTDEKAQAAVLSWSLRSESRARLEAVARLAQTEPNMCASPADFDRDPNLLNVANGVLDLRTGEFREHRVEDMLHRMSPVKHDPDATCPEFDKFLARV